MSTPPTREADHLDIVAVLDRYAEALDARDWALLDGVFLPDATTDYGSGPLEGRPAIVARIVAALGGCGPSQHLLGNYKVEIDGDRARTSCKIRVLHIGLGDKADLEPYELLAEYHDTLERTPDGWRIRHRAMRNPITRGDPRVLAPPA